MENKGIARPVFRLLAGATFVAPAVLITAASHPDHYAVDFPAGFPALLLAPTTGIEPANEGVKVPLPYRLAMSVYGPGMGKPGQTQKKPCGPQGPHDNFSRTIFNLQEYIVFLLTAITLVPLSEHQSIATPV